MVAAVNVTGIPEQTGLVEALIKTLTGMLGLTVMVITLEVAGLPVGHEIFEVNTHFIWSPFDGVTI